MSDPQETSESSTPELRLSYGFAKRHGVLLGEVQESGAQVFIRHDARPAAVVEVRRLVRRPLRVEVVDNQRFDHLLAATYDRSGDAAESMMADMEGELDLDRIAESLPEPEDLLESQDDAPIIRLINAILSQAVKENASDVHVEPFEDRLTVRLRVDGAMREILEPPRSLGGLIVSRIKVMARLDIAEKRLPQDGRISLRVGGRPVDVRVSTLPSGHGERVVLRLLDKQAGRLDLAHLGMDRETHGRIKELIQRPHGMILVTGPTGSGKTTTLYAVLAEINDRSRNILTVEDPVEYFIDGIGQTQVNTKVDMTFARGLRAILRQDPDVVMVGEIRDLETAEIAVQAGLTGHLVFSTLHTNTAVGAVTRLRDMGMESFLVSSTLLAVLAQRLVRLLCPHCKEEHELPKTDRDLLGIRDRRPISVYRPIGCPACNGTGYHGRSGIYELVVVDETMRQLIHNNASEAEIEVQARKSTPAIGQDGVRRILAGHTSIEEVLRVTRAA